MSSDFWYCPAYEKEIAHGLCWELCFSGIGGPIDTAHELDKWIKQTKKFKDIEDFHKVCETCIHCQWSR